MTITPSNSLQRYLKSISTDDQYKRWWNLYTPTDAEECPRGKAPEKTERFPVLAGLRKYAANHVLLVGHPGKGKSTALARLLLEEAQANLTPNSLSWQERGQTEVKIPVLVVLRQYQTSVLDLIVDWLRRHQSPTSKATIEKLLQEGRFLLLFDGINELPSDAARRDLKKFRETYRANLMIFTTRDLELGYDFGIEKKLEMQALTDEQIRQFVNTYLPQQGDELLQRLESNLQEFDISPLPLWMLCQLFQETGKVPANLGLIFRQFATLYDDKVVLSEAIDLKPIGSDISQLQIQSSNVLDALAGITQRLDSLMPSVSKVDTLENSLVKLAESLAQMVESIAADQAEIKSRLSCLESASIEPIQEEINHVKDKCTKLQESIDQLAYRMIADGVLGSYKSADAVGSWIDTIIQLCESEVTYDVLEDAENNDRREKQSQEYVNPTKTSQKYLVNELTKATSVKIEPTPQTLNWKCLHTLTGHSDSVTCLAISTNGKIIASGSYHKIKIWHLDTGELLQTLSLTSAAMAVTSIAISPDQTTLACANVEIEIWNLSTGEKSCTLHPSDWVNCVAISPDGQILISAGGDPVRRESNGSIQLWNLGTTNRLRTEYIGSDISSIALSPNGQILAIASYDRWERKGIIELWDMGAAKWLSCLEQPMSVLSVAFTPDGQTLVSGSADWTIKQWDLNTGKLIRTLTGHSEAVKSVAISPDGQVLASGSSDKTIKLWNLTTGELIHTLTEHADKISSVAFSPDGQTIVSGSNDKTIKIWRCY